MDTSGAGWGTVAESFGGNGDTGSSGGIVSALENIGVNFAAGAAAVGLSALGKSQGVSTAYPAYNPGALTRPPRSVPNYRGTYGASGSNVVLIGGALLIGGLLLFAAFGRRG
jgi:hypothetical protein